MNRVSNNINRQTWTPWWRNRWIAAGLIIALLGWGPLLAIIGLASIGLWPDPNPNPIGPGLLFFVTLWPGVICLGIGAYRLRRDRQPDRVASPSAAPAGTRPTRTPGAASTPTILRFIGGAAGLGLAAYGARHLRSGDDLRGAASAIVIGGALVIWALTNRRPRLL